MQRKDRPRDGPPQEAAARLLSILTPAVCAAFHALDVGDEALVFGPDGSLYLIRREAETTFRARPLEDLEAATTVALRWADAEHQAETVS
jgi:hypothetical protein